MRTKTFVWLIAVPASLVAGLIVLYAFLRVMPKVYVHHGMKYVEYDSEGTCSFMEQDTYNQYPTMCGRTEFMRKTFKYLPNEVK